MFYILFLVEKSLVKINGLIVCLHLTDWSVNKARTIEIIISKTRPKETDSEKFKSEVGFDWAINSLLSNIYFTKFVRYAFEFPWRQCNLTSHGLLICAGEDQRLCFNTKVSLRGYSVTPLLKRYNICFIQLARTCDCFLNNLRTKGDKTSGFCHLTVGALDHKGGDDFN